MSSTAAMASMPTSVFGAMMPALPALLATQPENWTAFGASIAGALLVMWGRERDQPLVRRAFSFVSAIFGGWSLPSVLAYNLPPEWVAKVPTHAPQTWALSGCLCGVISAFFFLLLIWAADSAYRRGRGRMDTVLNVIGPDPQPQTITDLGTAEDQAAADARLEARRAERERIKAARRRAD